MRRRIFASRPAPLRLLPGISAATLALATGAVVALLPIPARADLGNEPSTVRAIVGAKIVPRPGAEPIEGTLLVRDGRIEMLGTGVEVPTAAVVHERPGRYVYAAFVEPWLRVEAGEDIVPTKAAGGTRDGLVRDGEVHENPRVRAEMRAAESLPLDSEVRDEMRGAGYAVANLALDRGIFRGTTTVVALSDAPVAETILTSDAAQAFALEHGKWREKSYPTSLMGAIALARQTFLDATGRLEDPAGDAGPPADRSLRALAPVVEREMPLFAESEDVRMLPRVLAVAREAEVRPVIVSGGSDEYRRPDDVARWLREAEAGLVLTVDFPAAPRWWGMDGRTDVELDALRHWELAPTNPAALRDVGASFAVTTQGLTDRSDVRKRLREAVSHGLDPADALAALTVEPAELLGLSDRLGTLEAGKLANLVVTTGELFDADTRIEEVWIEGERFGDDPVLADAAAFEGTWLLTTDASGSETSRVEFLVKNGTLGGKVAGGDALEVPPTVARGTLVATIPFLDSLGNPAGPPRRVELVRDGAFLRAMSAGPGEGVLGRPVTVGKSKDPEEPNGADPLLAAAAPRWPPVAEVASPDAIFVRGATIWTCGPEGTISDADLLVVDGRVRKVGRDLSAPRDAYVIEGAGLHLTPGLIDCHSHSAISGGVNEGTHSCTAEVRIGDVVNPDSPALYRELAGGLTVSNQLHGSANVMGGQNAVIRNRWGEPAERLRFAGAPEGVKFALGENVKQSNWGDEYKSRYPQTRMGVEQFLRERFHAAVEYRREWEEWKRTSARRRGASPRRNLQLDALLEVLDGDRLVHCHSYRADEIVMLIRVAEDFGFTVGTFQHVLEGYKCADEIAAHGAGASSFTDWWSYKYEVVDAIPYNGELLWRRGVLTSFNSDSSELSRRMNLEAAKAVKWGGVPEEEALKFVTLFPARQLGIDRRVGSLEPGKDGDFVLWSDHPLSDRAVCLETWIEGVRRFSREEDLGARAAAADLRERLLEKAERVRDQEERDAPSPPGEGSLGTLWGESEAEAGLTVETGTCRAVLAGTEGGS